MNKIQLTPQAENDSFLSMTADFIEVKDFNKLKRQLNELKQSISDKDNDLLHTNNEYVKSVKVVDGKLVFTSNITDNEIGSVIWNKNLWDESKMDDEEFKREITSKRIVKAEGNEALTSRYITKYCGDLTGSVVYLGQCWSGKDAILAQSFLDKGAVAVIGSTKEIQGLYGNIMCYSTLTLLGKNLTLGEALEKSKEIYGSTDKVFYPEMDGARPKIFGNKDFKLNPNTRYDFVTIQPWEMEERQKGGDEKIKLPDGVENQSELITNIIDELPNNCHYSYSSKNEVITKELLAHLAPNQIIVFQGHGSYMDDHHEETLVFPTN